MRALHTRPAVDRAGKLCYTARVFFYNKGENGYDTYRPQGRAG